MAISFEDWFNALHGEIRVRPQNIGGGWQAFGTLHEKDEWNQLWDDLDFSRTSHDAIKAAQIKDDCVVVNYCKSPQLAFSECIEGLKKIYDSI